MIALCTYARHFHVFIIALDQFYDHKLRGFCNNIAHAVLINK